MSEPDISLFSTGQTVRDSDIWVSIPGLTYLERKDDEFTRFKLTSLDILAGRDMAEECAPDLSAPDTKNHFNSIVNYLVGATNGADLRDDTPDLF